MARLALFPVLLAAACLLAALYGAVHNQISYSVAPEYFHGFKFHQFAMAPDLHDRRGAALVGVGASWWMGLLLGLPVYLVAVWRRGTTRGFARLFLQAAALVVMITLAFGLGALVLAFVTIGPDSLPWWIEGRNIADPVSFARAGEMHNASYTGGLVGALAGMVWAGVAVWRSRTGRA